MNGRMLRRSRLIQAALVVVPLIAGCGDSGKPPLGRVYGKITYKGQPVSPGSVVFSPTMEKEGKTGQLALGTLEKDGSYDLTTFDQHDGAVLGEHIITVKSSVPIVQSTPPNSEAIKTKQPDGSWGYHGFKSMIPKKYSNPGITPLRQTVKEGRNEINIDLAD